MTGGPMDANNILGSLLVAAIVGLVTAVVRLWQRQGALELKMAESYIRKSDLDEVKGDVRAIRDLVHRLCTKLEVPVATEAYR